MKLDETKRQVNSLLDTPIEKLLASDPECGVEFAAKVVKQFQEYREHSNMPLEPILKVRHVLEEVTHEMQAERLSAEAHDKAISSGALQELMRDATGETIDVGAERIFHQNNDNSAKNYLLLMKALEGVAPEAKPNHVEQKSIVRALSNAPEIVDKAIDVLEDFSRLPMDGKTTLADFTTDLRRVEHYTDLQIMLAPIKKQFEPIAKGMKGIPFP